MNIRISQMQDFPEKGGGSRLEGEEKPKGGTTYSLIS